MNRRILFAMGACCALLGTGAFADAADPSVMPSGDGDENAAGQQAGAQGAATSDASGTGTKRAGTATAVGAVNDAVKEGKIKIEGTTDPGAPGF